MNRLSEKQRRSMENSIDKLIEELCPNGVEYKPLGEIGAITRGKYLQKKDFQNEGVSCIHYGQLYTFYKLYAEKTISFVSEEVAEKSQYAYTNDIIITLTSENVEDVCRAIAWIGKEKVAVSGHAAIITHKENAKYLAYYFQSDQFFKDKRKFARGAKVVEMKPEELAKICIPIPPIEIQEKIVSILDNFTNLISELESELEARKKQYEYYRNTLLNFTPPFC